MRPGWLLFLDARLGPVKSKDFLVSHSQWHGALSIYLFLVSVG
jgi:hypothetical protein